MALLCFEPIFIAKKKKQKKPYDWQCHQKEPQGMGKGSLPGKRKVLSRVKQNKFTNFLFLVSTPVTVKSKHKLPP